MKNLQKVRAGKLGGAVRSRAKSLAAKRNGKKGGRKTVRFVVKGEEGKPMTKEEFLRDPRWINP